MEKITFEDTIENIAKNTNRDGLLNFIYYAKCTPYAKISYFNTLTKKTMVTQYVENKAKYDVMNDTERLVFESDHIKKSKEKDTRLNAQERRDMVTKNLEEYRKAKKDLFDVNVCINNLEYSIKKLKETLNGTNAQINEKIEI